MCTNDELKTEIDAVEKRIEAQMQECREDVDQQIFKSHNAIAAVQSQNGAALKELTSKVDTLSEWFRVHDINEKKYQEKVDKHLEAQEPLTRLTVDDIQSLKDVAQGYSGMSAMRKMILGIASIVMAIGVVAGGFIALIKSIK